MMKNLWCTRLAMLLNAFAFFSVFLGFGMLLIVAAAIGFMEEARVHWVGWVLAALSVECYSIISFVFWRRSRSVALAVGERFVDYKKIISALKPLPILLCAQYVIEWISILAPFDLGLSDSVNETYDLGAIADHMVVSNMLNMFVPMLSGSDGLLMALIIFGVMKVLQEKLALDAEVALLKQDASLII